MTSITSRQRAFLRSQAHSLKPILHIGMDGVSPEVLKAIEEAFNTRELFKVKVLEGAPLKAREAGAAIAASVANVSVPQTIGRTVVLYRPFPDGPELELPR